MKSTRKVYDIKLGKRDETIGMRNASNREKNRL
jgi:hypothetical protein